MQLCSAAWYANRQQLNRSNLASQNAPYGAIVREWTECGRRDEEGYSGAPQHNEMRSMMCREGDDEPVVYVLENEDFHVEGEDCEVVVLEATTATLARVRVMKIEPNDSLKARCYWACLVMNEYAMSLCAKDVLERMLAQSLIARVFEKAGMRLLARPTSGVDAFNALIEVRVGVAGATRRIPIGIVHGQNALAVTEHGYASPRRADVAGASPKLQYSSRDGANTIQGLLLMSNPFLAFTLLPLRGIFFSLATTVCDLLAYFLFAECPNEEGRSSGRA